MRVANLLRPPAPAPPHEMEVESLQEGYPIRIRNAPIQKLGRPAQTILRNAKGHIDWRNFAAPIIPQPSPRKPC
jgi:hypothetical protein